jgi:cation transport ATPase
MISESMSMRWMVLAVFVLGLLGTGGELLFLGHIVGAQQLIPVVLMVMSLLVLGWHALDRKSASLRTFQITMTLLVVAGILGTVFHYWANKEFELEGDPSATGMPLFWKVMSGAAPALAPGAMVQLGLLGLIYTFRHPALIQGSKEE